MIEMPILSDEEIIIALQKAPHMEEIEGDFWAVLAEGHKRVAQAQRLSDLGRFVEWLEKNCRHIGTPFKSTKVEFTGFVAWMPEEIYQELKDKLAELELPSIDKFIGSDPDFTGDQTTEEYIKDMRGKNES